MAAALGPIVFVVVVVGGLGSIPGAFIASMLIGILQTFAVALDYSLLDLFRALGIAVRPGLGAARRLRGQDRPGRAHHPLPAPRAHADRAAARASWARAIHEPAQPAAAPRIGAAALLAVLPVRSPGCRATSAARCSRRWASPRCSRSPTTCCSARPACCPSATRCTSASAATRRSTCMRAINAGLPIPLPLVPLAGAARGPLLRHRLRRRHHPARRHDLRPDLAGRGRARARGLPHAAVVLRRRGGHHREPHQGAARSSASTSARSCRSTTSSPCGCSWPRSLMHAFMRTPCRAACATRCATIPSASSSSATTRSASASSRFSVAATFAGLAGGLHAINYEIVAAEAVGATRSGAVLLMVYIGGVGHFIGAILGAVAITWLQVSLSRLHHRVAALPRPLLHGASWSTRRAASPGCS